MQKMTKEDPEEESVAMALMQELQNSIKNECKPSFENWAWAWAWERMHELHEILLQTVVDLFFCSERPVVDTSDLVFSLLSPSRLLVNPSATNQIFRRFFSFASEALRSKFHQTDGFLDDWQLTLHGSQKIAKRKTRFPSLQNADRLAKFWVQFYLASCNFIRKGAR